MPFGARQKQQRPTEKFTHCTEDGHHAAVDLACHLCLAPHPRWRALRATGARPLFILRSFAGPKVGVPAGYAVRDDLTGQKSCGLASVFQVNQ